METIQTNLTFLMLKLLSHRQRVFIYLFLIYLFIIIIIIIIITTDKASLLKEYARVNEYIHVPRVPCETHIGTFTCRCEQNVCHRICNEESRYRTEHRKLCF